MNEPYEFDRITINPEVMGGKACIRGMRVTVGMIVNEISAGTTFDELLADSPIWNAKTSRRPCATPRGVCRNAKCCCARSDLHSDSSGRRD